MEYNTTRNKLALREYGRHVQKMVEHVMDIDEPERKLKNANAVIELMGFLNPHLKNVDDFDHMLWDHLYEISDFQLEVNSPYPKPSREVINAKPKPIPYPTRFSKYAHLGKNLEDLIKKALEEQDAEKKEGLANAVAYYMKQAYSNWHKETVHDDAIQSELDEMTNGQLTFTNTPSLKVFRSPENREKNNGFSNKRNKFQQRGGNNNGNRRNGNNNNNFKKKRF